MLPSSAPSIFGLSRTRWCDYIPSGVVVFCIVCLISYAHPPTPQTGRGALCGVSTRQRSRVAHSCSGHVALRAFFWGMKVSLISKSRILLALRISFS